MKRLIENGMFLRTCKNKSKCNHAIKNANAEEIRALCECAKNILIGNVSVSPHTLKKLRPYKKHLKFLSLKSNPIYKKKKVLQQGKGFFLPVLASIASTLVSSLLNKNGR